MKTISKYFMHFHLQPDATWTIDGITKQLLGSSQTVVAQAIHHIIGSLACLMMITTSSALKHACNKTDVKPSHSISLPETMHGLISVME